MAYWTLVSGSGHPRKVCIYGTKDVPSIENCPGSRKGESVWFDESKNILYIFGGSRSNLKDIWNDLWSYSIDTKEWTWLSGSDQSNQHGVYGTKGVASATCCPGSRRDGFTWIDESNSVLYLFGGKGYGVKGTSGLLNDLWSFSIKSRKWTWLSGCEEIDQKGKCDKKGVPSKENNPCSRFQGCSWIDKSNQILYLLGGYGCDINGKSEFFIRFMFAWIIN